MKRRTRQKLTFRGESRWATEWAKITGISVPAIYWRLANGYTVEQALTMPMRTRNVGGRLGHYIDHSGERHGKLEVLHYLRTDSSGSAVWLCRCECGSEVAIVGHRLKTVTSCGCDRKRRPPRKGEKPPQDWAEQPCWTCRKYAGGCCWSRELQPVPGWRATRTIKFQGTCGGLESYAIHECPEYEPDGTEVTQGG